MAYVLESDLLRPELLVNAANVVAVWPKVGGRNVQASAATWSAYKPDGVTLVESGSPSPSDVTLGARTVSRIDCSLAAIAVADQDYQLHVQYTVGGTTYDQIVLFDVCLSPLGDHLSLNDLQELEPDLPEALDRLGQRLGYTAGQTAQEYAAGLYVKEARQETQSRLAAHARDADRIRPHQMLNSRSLAAVERLFAMVAVYEALGGTLVDLDDRAESLRLKHWSRRADREWAALRITYMAEDATTTAPAGETNFGRAFTMERA